MNVLHPRLTPARRAWLEYLEQHGPAWRGRGRTGCDCMRLGWTEWVLDKNGIPTGEVITDAGREMLRRSSETSSEGEDDGAG